MSIIEGFTLSYPVSTVNWDGTLIRKVDEKSIDSALDVLAECGINELMLSGYTEAEPADFDMVEESHRIGNKLRARGMKGAQHHGLVPTFAPLGSSQDEVIRLLVRQIEFTANLNADVLVIHPGRIVGHHNTVQEFIAKYLHEEAKYGKQEVIKVSADNLHRAGAVAEKLGVKIALENVDLFEPLGDLENLSTLIRAADSDAVGFCLDSGHAHCCGNSIIAFIEQLGDKLFTTHFHDNNGPRNTVRTPGQFITPSGIDEHLPPGFGTIPWFDVIAALRKAGYQRTINFESGGWPEMKPQDGINAAIRFWRTCEYYSKIKSEK